MSIKLKSKESVYKHNRVNISSHLLLITHTHRKFGGHTEKSATARDCATGDTMNCYVKKCYSTCALTLTL